MPPMPIYEYICDNCRDEFEQLITGSQTPTCPKCEGEKLTKKLSVISTPNMGEKSMGGVCDPLPGGG